MTLEILNPGEPYIHLALAGKMDVVGAAAIEKEFLGALAGGGKHAIVDFSGVTFIGSMGLRVLLLAVKELRVGGRKLILLQPAPLVREILEASGIDDVLSIALNEEQAVALVG